MENLGFLKITFTDIIDIVLVTILLFYLYKLLKGTVAINIFLGIVIIYLIWKLTDVLNMNVLSTLLGKFISVGFFALIVVFQQEIRKFLLLIGSTNFTTKKNILKYFKFLNQENQSISLNVNVLVNSCKKMSKEKTGAIIIIERENNLEFIRNKVDENKIELSPQILETIFFKNSPLHDGAVIIKENSIIATRVILPVSESESIPKRFGLRHRAAIGISEKTDALAIVISEQTGIITYVKDSDFIIDISSQKLRNQINKDLSL
ncbi:MAG: diadenylate cyclase CdaA [Flavobacteriaceae bacterium]|nr:diadenylate cyclase CdaA [Flavobacteriaceae bacterium]